jgi:hypothetical protein
MLKLLLIMTLIAGGALTKSDKLYREAQCEGMVRFALELYRDRTVLQLPKENVNVIPSAQPLKDFVWEWRGTAEGLAQEIRNRCLFQET